MDTNLIESTLNSSFQNLSWPGPRTLIRCERVHRLKQVSVYYFDFSLALFEKDFDIRHYQEKYIAADYYQHQGHLQWNFYFVFVVEGGSFRGIPQATLTDVINDTSYARKHVILEDELSSFIADAMSVVHPTVTHVEDVVSLWKGKLDREGLSDIHRPGPRSKVLERIRTGGTLPSKRFSHDSEETVDTPFVHSFSALDIENYRRLSPGTYPLKRVNVLYGPNGSGKTSFLEAIELSICGATKRSGEEPETVVALEDESGRRFVRNDSASMKQFKEMARIIFGVSGGRGENPMPDAFARFNFFSSDAAYALAHDEDDNPSAIREAFIKIALGDQADRISKRLKAFCSELEKRCRERRREVDLEIEHSEIIDKEISALEAELKTRSSVSTADPSEIAARIGLLDKPSSAQTLRKTLSRLEISFERINSSADWLDKVTSDSIAIEKAQLEAARAKVENATTRRDEVRLELAKVSQEHTNTRRDLDLFRRAEEIRVLQGIELLPRVRELSALRGVASQLEKTRANALKLKNISELKKRFLHWGETADRSAEDLKNRLAVLRERIRDSEAVAGDAARLLSSLRTDGAEYLTLVDDQDTCPLCGVEHPPGALRNLLEREVDARDDNLIALKVEARTVESDAKCWEEVLQVRRELEKVGSQMGITSPNWDDTNEALKWIDSLEKNIENAQRDATTLEELETELMRRGMSFSEATSIDSGIQALLGKGISGIDDEEYAKAIGLREVEIGNLENKKRSLDLELKNLTEKIETTLTKALPGLYEVPHMLTLLTERLHFISDAMAYVENLKEEIVIDDRNLRTAATDIVTARRALDTDIALRSKLEDSSRLLKERREQERASSSHMNESKLELERYERAYRVVHGLLDEHSLDRHLSDFVEAYKLGILAIFKRIHSPREFDDLILGVEGDEEIVLVRNTGEHAKLHQVSTGQRSALALAIFLALNGSARAKLDLIMIDDPVAHIDDLNSLNFIDYLRNAAISGSQIFIATSSNKLRRLLEMKFSCLGDDGFQIIEFPDSILTDS